MSSFGGGEIVTNGLALALDAGNTKSYAGTGASTWFDKSGIDDNGTLTNGPTYSNGAIVFDGVDDRVTTVKTGKIVPNSFTYDLWCKPSATVVIYSQTTTGAQTLSGHRFLIYPDNNNTDAGAGISIGTNGINVFEHGNGFFPTPLTISTPISSTSFTNITLVYINKSPNLYINNSFIKTGLTTASPITYSSSKYIGGFVYGNYAGSSAIIRVYNRALTTQEIQQNYTATKSRFGL